MKTDAEARAEYKRDMDQNRAEFLALVEKAGLEFWTDPNLLTGSFYGYVTDGTRICYVQQDRNPFTGWSISTVHIPNKDTGTGYRLHDNLALPTAAKMESAMSTYCPNWDRRNASTIRKWSSWAEYQERDNWAGRYVRVRTLEDVQAIRESAA